MPLFSDKFPDPKIHPWMSHEDAAASGQYNGCTCEVSEVQFVTSLGTYLDSPYHFHPKMEKIEDLNLEQLVLPGVVVDCDNIERNTAIGSEVLQDIEFSGRAVLFRTGWSRYWKEPIYRETPFLNESIVNELIKGEAKLVGVDFLVVDNPNDPKRPVHTKLLEQRILIVENLTHLDRLPQTDFIFHAVPVKVAGTAAFPLRAYGVVYSP